MAKALYRSYRSRSFDELLGQDHIVNTLRNSIKKGQINHAYLLTGPRGVGKTSVARILAHEINGLPYNDESNHIDIIEIDGASNRRIEEVRDLRDKAHITPVSAKYKVYIIDEVHMLTSHAFNALLKTLEEPPRHVVFILATTEFHKLPDTIVSRCLRLSFRPISKDNIKNHLKKISKKEKYDISDSALALIADHGDGSFRDSISLLEQVNNSFSSSIDLENVENILGLAPKKLLDSLLLCIENAKVKQALNLLEEAYSKGADASVLSRQLSAKIRQQIIENLNSSNGMAKFKLLKSLSRVGETNDIKNELELTIIEACLVDNLNQDNNENDKNDKSVVKTKEEINTTITSKNIDITEKKVIKTLKKEKNEKTDIDNFWDEVLNKIKKNYFSLYGILRMAKYNQKNNKLILEFEFKFHYDQINKPENKKIITDILVAIKPEIEVIEPVLSLNSTKPIEDYIDEDIELKNITNIFGAGEVLES